MPPFSTGDRYLAAIDGIVTEVAHRFAPTWLIISAGFAEAGPEGERLQDELAQVVRRTGLRVVGPNCQGVNMPHEQMCASWPLITTRGKIAFASTFFAAVLLLAGIATSPIGAVGAIGVSILTSFAFAAPIVAFSVTQKSDQGFAFIFRLIITPLAFFSGTYFPIENLPFAAQLLAWCTPLAHAVALSRAALLGTELAAVWLHVAALLLWGIVGTIAAIYLFRKRMLK